MDGKKKKKGKARALRVFACLLAPDGGDYGSILHNSMVYISKNIALVLFCPFLSRFSISTNRKQSKLEDPDFLGG